MTAINRVVGAVVGGMMSLLGSVPPIVSLALLSLLTALALLLVVGAASDQPRIRAVKRAIRATLFEIRLFNDDLRAILRAQGEMIRHNLTYLRLSLVPMLWVLVPLALLLTHLQVYYGYDGLTPGATALVTVRLAEDWRSAGDGQARVTPALTLDAPPGLSVETPRVWIPSLREAAWRIRAEQPGDYEVVVRMPGAAPSTKTVRVSNGLAERSAVRAGGGLLDEWLHPAEAPLPSGSPLDSIAVTYPERGIRIAGADVHWTIVYFVLTMAFAFFLKGRVGVVL